MSMRTFAIPAGVEDEKRSEQAIRDFVRQWVGLLADRKHAEALEMLSPEIPPGSGSVDSRRSPQWTPSLLEAVIANYGTPEPLADLPPLQPQPFAVVPLDSSLLDAFEANLSIEFDHNAISRLHQTQNLSPATESPGVLAKLSRLLKAEKPRGARKIWLGGVDFDLPLNYARGNDIGDLSARMLFKPVTKNEMVLVLLDIHVL